MPCSPWSVRKGRLLIVDLMRNAVRYAEHRRQRVGVRVGRRKIEEAHAVRSRSRLASPTPPHLNAGPERLCFTPIRWGHNAVRSGTRSTAWRECPIRDVLQTDAPDSLSFEGRAGRPGLARQPPGGPSWTYIRRRGLRSQRPRAALLGPARHARGPSRTGSRPCTSTGRRSTTTAPSTGHSERTPAKGGARGRADAGGFRALLQMPRLRPAGAHRLARAGGRPLFAVSCAATGAGGALSGSRAALG